MHLINNIIEPKRLLMVWQTLDRSESAGQPQGGVGKRYVVGELRQADKGVVLRYFKDSQDFKDAKELGFEGYPAFDISKPEHTNVMSALERRIPPRERSDFSEFLKYHRIAPGAAGSLSPFALLGYTGGKLPGDSFSFVHTFEEAPIPCELTVEVAGFRYYKGMDLLKQGNSLVDRPVQFKAEPENPYDSHAVAIYSDGEPIGHVNRAQTEAFNKWLQCCRIEGNVERVNGRLDRPSVLLYVKVEN